MAIKEKWIEFNLNNGTNGYIDAGTGEDAYKINNTLTVEAWIWVDSAAGSSPMGILSNLEQNGGYCFYIAQGQLCLQLNGTIYKSTASVVASGAWHHVGAIYNGTSVTFYVDSSTAGSSVASNITLNYADQPSLFIGRGPVGTSISYFKGKICEVRIWDVARTLADFVAASVQALDSSVANLRARWPLDDGSNSTTNDARNGLNATLNASAIPGSSLIPPTPSPTATDIAQPSVHIDTSAVLTAALDRLNRTSVMALLKQLTTQIKSQAGTIKTHNTTITAHGTKIDKLRTDLDEHLLNHDKKIHDYVDTAIEGLLSGDEFAVAAANLAKLQKELEIVRTAALSLDTNELSAVTKAIGDALRHPDLGKLILSAQIPCNNGTIDFGTLLSKLARRVEVTNTEFTYDVNGIDDAIFTMSDGTRVTFSSTHTISSNILTYTFTTSNLQGGLAGTFQVKLRKNSSTDSLALDAGGTVSFLFDEYEAVSHSNVYYDLNIN